ncbi:MAG: filamentous hemagglutinin N-terminal domain-containing protein, partial [Prochlorococcaceae cyanobacterium]
MGHLQRLLLATALGLSVMPAAQAQLPSGPSVRSGRVGIQRSGNELIIRSASQRSVINWNRFSIGPDQIVTYYQPSRSATVLNQVTSGVRSVIRGLMQSCLSAGGECRPTQGRGKVGGGVILVNPAGISVLGGQIITDHTLLTTAGINVQEFISSGVINLTLAGDGLIEIGQGATLSGPLSNPTGLEGLSVVAPRIVVDGSVNIPEASSFIVQPQAKGTTEFVFNNVRPSRSFLKLDPGVHH